MGGVPRDASENDLRGSRLAKCGDIIDVDVKKCPQPQQQQGQQQQQAPQAYAMVQFADVASVVKAIRTLEGETAAGLLGSSSSSSPTVKLRLGFGRVMPTKCVWCSGLRGLESSGPGSTEKTLASEFGRFGKVQDVIVDRVRGQALVYFDQVRKSLSTSH